MTGKRISYSTFDIESIKKLIREKYGLHPVEVVFLKRGFNDTYKVASSQKQYILRIYRTQRRKLADIHSELNMLCYLDNKGIPVSVPLPGLHGELLFELPAEEGMRYSALFTFTGGKSLRKPDPGQCRLAGSALGTIHKALAHYDPGVLAWNYDPSHVFSYTLNSLTDTLKNYPEDLDWIRRFEVAFKKATNDVSYENGICHGDLQPENFFFTPGGEVSFIDFDFCGKGPLLYDLGAYTWYDHKGKTKEMLQAFYNGYAAESPLSEEARALIPLFGALRGLFLMGMWNSFMDGSSNPVWPPDQIGAFVGKLKRWLKEECGVKV